MMHKRSNMDNLAVLSTWEEIETYLIKNQQSSLQEAAFTIHPCLTEFDINSNYAKIGQEGAILLADALKRNTTLKTLLFGGNNIGDVGCEAFADALCVNSSLTSLSIGGNRFGEVGCVAIAEALKYNTSLTLLDITCNPIGDVGCCAIADTLRCHNSTLSYLNIGANEIGDVGCRAMSNMLRSSVSITQLMIHCNKFSRESLNQFAEDLQYNYSLTTLWIDNNIDEIKLILLKDKDKRKEEVLARKKLTTTASNTNNSITNSIIKKIGAACASIFPATVVEENDNSITDRAQSAEQHQLKLTECTAGSTTSNSINDNTTDNSNYMTIGDIKKLKEQFNKLDTVNQAYISNAIEIVARHEQLDSKLTELHQLSHQLLVASNKGADNSNINVTDYKKLVTLTKQKNIMLQHLCSEKAQFGYFNAVVEYISNLATCYKQFDYDYLSYYILLHQNQINIRTCKQQEGNSFAGLYTTDFNEKYTSLQSSFVQLENNTSERTEIDNQKSSLIHALLVDVSSYINQCLDFFSSLKHTIHSCMQLITQCKSRCVLTDVETEYNSKQPTTNQPKASWLFDINDYFPASPSKLSTISNYAIAIIIRLQGLQKRDTTKLLMEQGKLNYTQSTKDEYYDDEDADLLDEIDIAKVQSNVNTFKQRIKERKGIIMKLKSKYAALIVTLFPEWKYFFNCADVLQELLNTVDIQATDISLADYSERELITQSSSSRNRVYIATPPALLSNNNTTTSTSVILKEFDIDSAEGAQAFKRESLLLHRMQHPHIASIDLVFIANSKGYIQMPYYENRDLLYWRTNSTANNNISSDVLTETQVRTILYQALLALQKLHRHNVVHCDIKPQNLLVSKEGVIKIADFDISRSTANRTAFFKSTTMQGVGGTLGYMAPELFDSQASCSFKLDIYGLGVTIQKVIDPNLQLNMLSSSLQLSEKLKQHYSNELLHLLERMVYANVLSRPSATELLADSYFINNTIMPTILNTPTTTNTTQSSFTDNVVCLEVEIQQAIAKQNEVEINLQQKVNLYKLLINTTTNTSNSSNTTDISKQLLQVNSDIDALKLQYVALASSIKLLKQRKLEKADKIAFNDKINKFDLSFATPIYWHSYYSAFTTNASSNKFQLQDMMTKVYDVSTIENQFYLKAKSKLLNETSVFSDTGVGRDSHNQQFKQFKVIKVHRIENSKLWRNYAHTREMIKIKINHFNNINNISAGTSYYKFEDKTQSFATFRPWQYSCDATAYNNSNNASNICMNLMNEANEVLLFHGTNKHVAEIIKNEGFEERVSRKGSFGCGIYFAENAVKADQYAGNSGIHYMIASRIVLGNIKVIHQRSELNFNDAKRPPLLPCSTVRADSLLAESTV